MISLDAGGFLFQQNAFYMKMFITVEPWYNELFRFNPGDSKIYGNMKKKLDVNYRSSLWRTYFTSPLAGPSLYRGFSVITFSQSRVAAPPPTRVLFLGTRALVATPSGVSKFDFSDNFLSKNSAQIQNFTSWHYRGVNLVDCRVLCTERNFKRAIYNWIRL